MEVRFACNSFQIADRYLNLENNQQFEQSEVEEKNFRSCITDCRVDSVHLKQSVKSDVLLGS